MASSTFETGAAGRASLGIELGSTREVFREPRHPYSVGLLQAFPSIRGELKPLTGIPGSPPDLRSPPKGCRFHPRCPKRFDPCDTVVPGETTISGADGSVGAEPCHLDRTGEP